MELENEETRSRRDRAGTSRAEVWDVVIGIVCYSTFFGDLCMCGKWLAASSWQGLNSKHETAEIVG